jgi:hypothetical protein
MKKEGKDRAEAAIRSVLNYIENQNKLRSWEMAEVVLQVLGDTWDFEDEAYNMKHLCTELLILMTDPQISKRVNADQVGEKLSRLIDFFGSIFESELIKAQLQIEAIKSDFCNDQILENIEQEYMEKTQLADCERGLIDRRLSGNRVAYSN